MSIPLVVIVIEFDISSVTGESQLVHTVPLTELVGFFVLMGLSCALTVCVCVVCVCVCVCV